MVNIQNKIENYVFIIGGLLFFIAIALFALSENYLLLGIPFICAGILWPFLNFKSFYWFLILTIPFSFTIYFLNNSLATTVPDEPIMWFLLILSALIILYNRKSIPEWFLRNPITLILALQLVWLIISVIFSTDKFLSLKFLASKLWFWNAYIIIPLWIFKTKKDFKTAFLLFVIPTVLHAIFAFTWHYTLDFGFWDSNKVVRPFYFNHVDYSTVLSMVFPLLIIAYQLSKGKKWQRIILLATIIFFIPAIFFASARAAILAVIFAMGIAFMVRIKLVQIVMPIFYGIIIVLMTFMVTNNNYLKLRPDKSQTATQETFIDAITGAFKGKDMSSMERIYRWIASVRMSGENPIVGVGPNNFYEHYKKHTVTSFETWVSRNPERSTTHNYFLFMLVEQGWPAMIFYAWLIMAVFKRGQIIYHRTKDPFYKKMTMGLIMMFAAGFVNNFFSELLETHKIGALFYLSITLIIILDYITKKEEEERSLLTPQS